MPPNRQNPNGEPINSLLVEEKLDDRERSLLRDHDRPHDEEAGDHGQPSAAWTSRKLPRSIPSRSPSTASIRRSATRRSSAASSRSPPNSIPAIARASRRSSARCTSCSLATARTWSRSIRSRSPRTARHRLRCEGRTRRRRAVPHARVQRVAQDAAAGRRRSAGVATPAWAFATSAASPGTVGTMANGAGLGDGDDGCRQQRRRRDRELPRHRRRRQAERVRKCYELVVNHDRREGRSSSTSSAASRAATKSRAASSKRWRTTKSRKIPLVIRLTGTNEEEGRAILAEAGMTPVETMDEGAAQAVRIAAESE